MPHPVPGPYLQSKFPYIVEKVNAALGHKPAARVMAVGDTVKLRKGAKTFDGVSLASFVYNRNHVVKEIKGNRVVITYGGVVVAAVNKSDLTII